MYNIAVNMVNQFKCPLNGTENMYVPHPLKYPLNKFFSISLLFCTSKKYLKIFLELFIGIMFCFQKPLFDLDLKVIRGIEAQTTIFLPIMSLADSKTILS